MLLGDLNDVTVVSKWVNCCFAVKTLVSDVIFFQKRATGRRWRRCDCAMTTKWRWSSSRSVKRWRRSRKPKTETLPSKRAAGRATVAFGVQSICSIFYTACTVNDVHVVEACCKILELLPICGLLFLFELLVLRHDLSFYNIMHNYMYVHVRTPRDIECSCKISCGKCRLATPNWVCLHC